MALFDKISGFGYFPFLNHLLQKGEYQWRTPLEKGKEVFVTTLYLDGDMLCWFLSDETEKSFTVEPEILDDHLRKIDKDLNSIHVLSNHLSMLTGFLIAMLTFILNPSGWFENFIILAGIAIIGFIGRKFTAKMAFKILGTIAGKFVGKSLSGTKK